MVKELVSSGTDRHSRRHTTSAPSQGVGAAKLVGFGDLTVGDTIFSVPSDDDAMERAIEKAHRTLHYFEASLLQPSASMSYFYVKARFPVDDGDGGGEHIWLGDAEFDSDGNLFGIVGNEPQYVKSLALGQRVGVDRADVTDWMIIDNGRLTGGYTICAIRNGLPDAERAAFDRGLGGMMVDAADDQFERGDSSSEGLVLAYEDALEAQDYESVASLQDFVGEARAILAADNEAAETWPDEAFDQMVEVIRTKYIESLMQTETPRYTGVRRAYPAVHHAKEGDLAIVSEILTFSDGEIAHRHLVRRTAEGWRMRIFMFEPEGELPSPDAA